VRSRSDRVAPDLVAVACSPEPGLSPCRRGRRSSVCARRLTTGASGFASATGLAFRGLPRVAAAAAVAIAIARVSVVMLVMCGLGRIAWNSSRVRRSGRRGNDVAARLRCGWRRLEIGKNPRVG
jgi:hypothetical protein